MNVKRWSHAVAMGLVLTVPAAASEPLNQLESQTVTVEATVKAVDHKTRMVTVESEGDTMEIKASPKIKRLDEIKKGDAVVLTYHKSLAMSIVPEPAAAQTAVAMTEAAGRAPKTQSPAGAAVNQIEAIVEITAIDKEAQTVSVKGPEGNVVTVQARHPENLEKIKVGDKVHIVYTEAVAVAIEPKTKK